MAEQFPARPRAQCGRKHYCGVVLGTHAPACSVEGLRDAVAGERVPFLIIARDLTGALRTTGVPARAPECGGRAPFGSSDGLWAFTI